MNLKTGKFSKFSAPVVALTMLASSAAFFPARPAQAGVLVGVITAAACYNDDYYCMTDEGSSMFLGFLVASTVITAGETISGIVSGNWTGTFIAGGILVLPANQDTVQTTLQNSLPELAPSEVAEFTSMTHAKLDQKDFRSIAESADHTRSVLQVCFSQDEVNQVLAAGDYSPAETQKISNALGCNP